ncbi:MAG: hypothetical protein ABI459_03875 [Deltaproteobacteria bacterium]
MVELLKRILGTITFVGLAVVSVSPAKAEPVSLTLDDIVTLALRPDLDQEAFIDLMAEMIPEAPRATKGTDFWLQAPPFSEQFWMVTTMTFDPLKVPPPQALDCVHIAADAVEQLKLDLSIDSADGAFGLVGYDAEKLRHILDDAGPLPANLRSILSCDLTLIQRVPAVEQDAALTARVGDMFQTVEQTHNEGSAHNFSYVETGFLATDGPEHSAAKLVRLEISDTVIKTESEPARHGSTTIRFIAFELNPGS